ncbi:hypothetical protein FRC12_011979 [Ceratobasidium sp. 428]|nr:hypothetical protein FRC12_011979 [Ceratobasidium sp. 428]
MSVSSGSSHVVDNERLVNRAGSPKDIVPQRAPVVETTIFALIIGINTYPKLKQLAGAVTDAKAIQEFLINDLHVSPKNINILLDADATREAILGAFQALISDPQIQTGDPILVFFAGHGGHRIAPPPWLKRYGYTDIQAIFPYNYDPKPQPPTENTNCIPDITIRALLNRLAKEKGDNITLILDSCHSASGDRTDDLGDGVPDQIARDAEVQIEVPCGIDSDIISSTLLDEAHPSGQSSESPRCPELPLHTDQASHVLLAAAGSNQKAWEESGRGRFTSMLLAGIRGNGGARNITYENLIISLKELPGNQTPHCYGYYKSRILFNFPKAARKASFIPVKYEQDTWILQAGSSSGVTEGSVWALHDTAAEDSQPMGYLQTLEPGVSTSTFTMPQPNSSHPAMAAPPKRTSIIRMYARRVTPGAGQAPLKVYFSCEAKSLLFGPDGNASTHSALGVIQDEIVYAPHDTLKDSEIAVDLYCPDSYSPGTRCTKVIFTLVSPLAQQCGVATLEYPMPARRSEVDRVLSAAAHWYWHLKRTSVSTSSKPTVSLEFTKLGVSRGEHIVRLEGKLENLINKNGVVDIRIKKQDQYGLKISSQSEAELYIQLFYFSARDFSIMHMFGHSKANGRPDPDIPKRGQRIIGDEADGGSLLSFELGPGQELELGYIKVFWCTDPLELDDLVQDSPFEIGACQGEGRAPIVRTPKQWGAETITLVQRA